MTDESPLNQEREAQFSAGDSTYNRELIDDPSLELLRDILFSQYRQRLAELEAELNDLEQRLNNKEAFVAVITPVLGDAIRRKIRDARAEMIEALYPIIGQMVVRAVAEATRELARSIDAQLRAAANVRTWGRYLRAEMKGVSSAEMILRESLPFQVAELFLIHRESGLLLWHLSRDAETSSDSDLISGMLTAIRDFAQESFGRGKEGQLDEIQYGEWRILIEAGQYAYLAVVIDGVEPAGFRAEMRERIIEVNYAHEPVLRNYQGDPAPLAPVAEPLGSLFSTGKTANLSRGQKRFLAAAVGLLGLCILASGLSGDWVYQATHPTPTPAPVVIQPTPTPSFTATPTPTSTATPTPTFTFTPTPTSTPTPTFTPTPVIGFMLGNVWLHADASGESPRLGMILGQGQPVEILASNGTWYRLRWTPPGEAEIIGWAPAEWVGTVGPIPGKMITPTTTPLP